jgi:hypothetical protein
MCVFKSVGGSLEVVKALIDYEHHLIDKKRRDKIEKDEEKRRLASRGIEKNKKKQKTTYTFIHVLSFSPPIYI